MILKTSSAMEIALEAIRIHGHLAIPEGGGFWKGKDGDRLPVSTSTVYALARRGLLTRKGEHRESWRDTYMLTYA